MTEWRMLGPDDERNSWRSLVAAVRARVRRVAAAARRLVCTRLSR
ncbi:MAG TPA: hypothetical protein VF834_14460 [Streptosporangiaceae bacterium]